MTPALRCLWSSGEQEHDDDHHHESQQAAGCIAPALAMRPGGYDADQHQDQDNNSIVPRLMACSGADCGSAGWACSGRSRTVPGLAATMSL